MKSVCFVGVDTSNYTTSIAACDEAGEIIANLKAPLPVAKGERGLRQSEALFAHTKNLPALCDELSKAIRDYTPIAIGCSARPRNIAGSYMPCFLAGIAAAHSFAASEALPVYEFSHQDGHVMAALHSSRAKIAGDFAAFHVSGGTTEILYIKQTKDGFKIELVGGTNDLNAGQCIDRTGVMLGIDFPCGAQMDNLALENSKKLAPIKISVKELRCNLSGLENLAADLWKKSEDRSLVSAYAFEYISKTLYSLTDNLRAVYPDLSVVYAGGVMSSTYIKSRLQRDNVYFAMPAFSADNAAGISLLCRNKYFNGNN